VCRLCWIAESWFLARRSVTVAEGYPAGFWEIGHIIKAGGKALIQPFVNLFGAEGGLIHLLENLLQAVVITARKYRVVG
jgi:hypothetical protein